MDLSLLISILALLLLVKGFDYQERIIIKNLNEGTNALGKSVQYRDGKRGFRSIFVISTSSLIV